MPNSRNTLIMLFVFLAAACLVLACCTVSETNKHESAMDRVLRTGTLRCSYTPYSSYFRKDPNTGQLSGIFYDVMKEIGKNSGLKVEWVEEVGYQSIFSGLEADRYDIFAAGLWPNATRAKAGLFTIPIFYSAITTWVRPDDHRFDSNLSVINSRAVRIATIDGAVEDIIAKTDFSKAQLVSLPELSPFSQNLLNVVNKKADLTFAEPMVVREFLVTNPGTLKQVAPDKPLRIFGNALVVKREEASLKEFLNVALKELVDSGRVDKILATYKIPAGTYYLVAHPYGLPQEKTHE